jgi:phosphatidate phosphatase APP1
MNPKIIATQSYSDALLPRKGLQTWFKHLSSLLKIEEKFKETALLLEEEMSELPVDVWAKLVKEFTTRQIPTISSFMKHHLKKIRTAPIESIEEIANLNDCDIGL